MEYHLANSQIARRTLLNQLAFLWFDLSLYQDQVHSGTERMAFNLCLANCKITTLSIL